MNPQLEKFDPKQQQQFSYPQHLFHTLNVNTSRYEITNRDKALHLHIHPIKPFDQHERQAVQNYIRSKYFKIHHASLSHFSSQLFIGKCKQNIKVAIGVEHLSRTQAFLEQYLHEPIEKILSERLSTQVLRENVVEIGHLASENAEFAKMMVAFLVFHLNQKKIDWAVCTGTLAVRYVLQQMGIGFQVLEKADPAVLGNAQQQWGNYYQQKPMVLVIDVTEALKTTQSKYSFTDQYIAQYGALIS